jgi:hypothetical protein
VAGRITDRPLPKIKGSHNLIDLHVFNIPEYKYVVYGMPSLSVCMDEYSPH